MARLVLTWRAALDFSHGDFYATLPGPYSESINPTLWNSADLAESWAFHKRTYLHGPTQFLTLYPIAWLNSYESIARVLLVLYSGVVVATCVLLTRLIASQSRASQFALSAGLVLNFYPLLQALQQREFEIVITAATALLCVSASRERQGVTGAVAAFIAGFKYLQLLYLPLFVALRWWRATLSFIVSASAIALLARILLGPLGWFFNNNVPGLADRQFGWLTSPSTFCRDWTPEPLTYANVRWGLCGWAGASAAPVIYVLLCVVVLAVCIVSWWRLEHAPAREVPWRRTIEIGLVASVAATFFFGHHYYLSVLAVPIVALALRYFMMAKWPLIAGTVLAASYLLLSAGPLPMSLASRLSGLDWYIVYLRYRLYLPGELLLIGLLLWEYWRLARFNTQLAAADFSSTG